MPAISAPSSAGQLPSPDGKPTPTFSPDDVTVVFVLGGPGAGKGTQCANLVKEYGFTHLSAGDLLRAEQDRPGSQFGGLIKDCIKNGAIVPMEVTVQLLENAMTETIKNAAATASTPTSGPGGPAAAGKSTKSKAKFLIDGFPRKMDQALMFEEAVCPARFVLFYDCPEAEMERRLLERGKTSGRSDDNAESIRKRFRTFVETSMPVIDHYEAQGRVIKVDATATPAAVYKDTRGKITRFLGDSL
ncbi:uridylate kinase [Bombardia bombarda]|uniref:Uridylate kinase n=1 Tax=Bombardia bombarda TaxID=252184 RepID=A0AA40BYI7_9PEZI|nr:uridylate kinase [Bombardia bombarda]